MYYVHLSQEIINIKNIDTIYNIDFYILCSYLVLKFCACLCGFQLLSNPFLFEPVLLSLIVFIEPISYEIPSFYLSEKLLSLSFLHVCIILLDIKLLVDRLFPLST